MTKIRVNFWCKYKIHLDFWLIFLNRMLMKYSILNALENVVPNIMIEKILLNFVKWWQNAEGFFARMGKNIT